MEINKNKEINKNENSGDKNKNFTENSSKIEATDILLNILWEFGRIKSRRRLNAIVFLIQCELQKEGNNILNYKFYDTITGPYSKELMEDIETLANVGLINERDMGEEGLFTHYYSLTDFGKTAFEWTIKETIPPKIREVIRKSSKIYKKLSWFSLLEETKKYDKFLSKEPLSIFED